MGNGQSSTNAITDCNLNWDIHIAGNSLPIYNNTKTMLHAAALPMQLHITGISAINSRLLNLQ